MELNERHRTEDEDSSIGSVELASQSSSEHSETSLLPYGRTTNPPTNIQNIYLDNILPLKDLYLSNSTMIELNAHVSQQEAEIISQRLRQGDETLICLKLENVFADNSFIQTILEALQAESCKLKELHLSCLLQFIGPTDLPVTLETLKCSFLENDITPLLLGHNQSQNLEILTLVECEMDPFWELRLVNSFEHRMCRKLQELSITTPVFTDPESASIFFASLSKLQLRLLLLSGMEIIPCHQERLSSYLPLTLENLKLGRNNLGLLGSQSIADFITNQQSQLPQQPHKNLKILDISMNRLNSQAIEVLAQAIGSTNTLEELQLHHAGIDNQSLKSLAKMLQQSSLKCSLRKLIIRESLQTCQHSRTGVEFFLRHDGVQQNTSLTTLTIWPDYNLPLLQNGCFYARCNQAGRKWILEGGETFHAGLWPYILERHETDVLYHLLRESCCFFLLHY